MELVSTELSSVSPPVLIKVVSLAMQLSVLEIACHVLSGGVGNHSSAMRLAGLVFRAYVFFFRLIFEERVFHLLRHEVQSLLQSCVVLLHEK